MADYLLEIVLSLLPSLFLSYSSYLFYARLNLFFSDNLLDYKKIQTFSTPRRLEVLVQDLSNYSQSKDEE
ncbi:glycine--tRNA ligase subunit beta, partial [Oenococcus oeni]|uniref:glycine--tRNA ligase subunit beta n=1 Tax=Oenococcus oeni TaxID=1247 RepID=UPI000AC7F185